MEALKFSYNWNNKLDCKAFTSLRLSDRFQVGQEYKIELRGKGGHYESKGVAKIQEIRQFKLAQLNAFVAYLDTGYSLQECKDILMRMYKVDWDSKLIKLILFVYN